MRRAPVLLAACLAAAATAVSGMSAGLGAQATAARLRLVDTDPVTLRATGFKPNEHARLVILAGQRLVRRATTAGPGGAFTMVVRGLDVNACKGFSVTATGDKGSRATYKRPPGVCPQP
jgi:hypothetical protein